MQLHQVDMAFLVTEIAMDVMGCKYFDIEGNPVSSLENLVKFNKAGSLETAEGKQKLSDYLGDQLFYDYKGERIDFDFSVTGNTSDSNSSKRMSYPPPPARKGFPAVPSVPKISSARSLVPSNIMTVPKPQPQTMMQAPNIVSRRPSFVSQFSSFIAGQSNEKPHPAQRNSNASLFKRSMTQIGNRKIVIRPKPQTPKPVKLITVPLPPARPPVPLVYVPVKVPKVISVRPTASMLVGGGGTQYKAVQPTVSVGNGTQFSGQSRNGTGPAVSGGDGTQFSRPYSNQPALSGGAGTQFGVPDHSKQSVSRILHRRHTLFQKQPY